MYEPLEVTFLKILNILKSNIREKEKEAKTFPANNYSKSLDDVGLRAELNLWIILISSILMFLGTTVPPILTEYCEVNLILGTFIGAFVSIVANLMLLYGLRQRLVKVFSVRVKDEGKGTEEAKVEKNP